MIADLAGAMARSRLTESLLFGITSGDARTLITTPPVLVLAAACLIPVRRALRIDPMIAIRSD